MEEATTAGGQDWWQFLAVELKQHIWSHLGVKEIIMATTVCSEWRNILLADQHQPWATIFQRYLGGPGPQKNNEGQVDSYHQHMITTVRVWKAAVKRGTTPGLIWCCSHGHDVLLLTMLANSDYEWDVKSSQEHELFLKTVQAGHANILSILFEKGHFPPAISLCTLVHCAAEKGHAQTLSILLRNEARIRAAYEARGSRPELGVEDVNKLWKQVLLDSLFIACKNGDVVVAQVLLDLHPEKDAVVNLIDATHNFAPTAMHHACIGGSAEMVRFLIAAGAHYQDTLNTDPPLFLAINHGHFDLVKELVEELAFDINQEGPSGSAITKAAAVGRPEILQYLLNRPECLLEGRLESAMSAACGADKLACVRILLEADPQMNCYNATEAACAKGRLHIVKFLVEHQPQIIELASSGGEPCLLRAGILCARRGKLDVLSFLLEKGLSPNINPPGSACALAVALKQEDAFAFNRLEVIRMLLKAGADVNKLVENPSLQSPSFDALKSYLAGKTSKDVLQLLVDAGLDLSVREHDTGNTLLHLPASHHWRTETSEAADEIDFLCNLIHEWGKSHPHSLNPNNGDHDIDSHSLIDIPNFDGQTPLMQAVQNVNFPLVEALLKCGADLSRPAFGQHSILHWVIQDDEVKDWEPITKDKDEIKMARFLLKYKAPTDKVYPKTGRTLLHEACKRRGRTPLVKALLKKGRMDPNCTIPNPKGGDPITPLMLAISQNDVETVELLIKRGAIVGESEKKAFPHGRGRHLAVLRGILDKHPSSFFSFPPTSSSLVPSSSSPFTLDSIPSTSPSFTSAQPSDSIPPTSFSSVLSSSPPFTPSSIPSTPTSRSFTVSSSSTPPTFSIPPTFTSAVPDSTSTTLPSRETPHNLPMMDPSSFYPTFNYSALPSTQSSGFSFSLGGGRSQQTTSTPPPTLVFGEKPSSSSS